jgi:hypothetical protein
MQRGSCVGSQRFFFFFETNMSSQVTQTSLVSFPYKSSYKENIDGCRGLLLYPLYPVT